MFQIKLMLMLFVIAGGAGGYFYVQKLQADLKISEANNAKLESAVGEQQALVEQMKKDFAKIQSINKELETKNAKLKASEKSLSDKLGRHDIGILAQNKPGLVEKVLNNASINANRCIEIVSGAELTEKELNATKPSEINAECWQIANPNFDPEAQSDAWKEKNL
jgi:septal ring factor EnvC (AmiA/AmiB activator)